MKCKTICTLSSCVAKEKCEGNKVERRSGGLLGLEIAAADNGICPNESDVCCSDEEIVYDCSDYSADGYKCVNGCFDMPQDVIHENERVSNISPFRPKEAKCLRGQMCCKRDTPPSEKWMPEDTHHCEDVSPGYKCLDFDECDPDSIFFSKNNQNITVCITLLTGC